MNTLALLLGLLVCVIMVSGRHYAERRDEGPTLDSDSDSDKEIDHSQMRHRKRRWQMNYGYDYQPPANPYYHERRDYDRNHDILIQIYRLLEDISAQMRRPPPPPPPPQPIYIPYPVPYSVPQSCSCKRPQQPNITSRFPDMEDINQNWGLVVFNTKEDDSDDGARPISFTPIRPIRPMSRPSPPVEHGSVQADSQAQTTAAPKFDIPGMCNAAIISCCGFSEEKQKQCFVNIGCGTPIDNACSKDSVAGALDAFKNAYQPINN